MELTSRSLLIRCPNWDTFENERENKRQFDCDMLIIMQGQLTATLPQLGSQYIKQRSKIHLEEGRPSGVSEEALSLDYQRKTDIIKWRNRRSFQA